MKTLVMSAIMVMTLLSGCVTSGPVLDAPEYAYLKELASFTSLDPAQMRDLLKTNAWTIMSESPISDKISLILAKSGHAEIMSVVFLGNRIYRIEIYKDIRKGAFGSEWNTLVALVRKYYNPDADAYLEDVDPSDESAVMRKIEANDGTITIGTVMKTDRSPVFTCVPRVKDGSIIFYLTFENESLVGDVFGT